MKFESISRLMTRMPRKQPQPAENTPSAATPLPIALSTDAAFVAVGLAPPADLPPYNGSILHAAPDAMVAAYMALTPSNSPDIAHAVIAELTRYRFVYLERDYCRVRDARDYAITHACTFSQYSYQCPQQYDDIRNAVSVVRSIAKKL